MRSMETLSSIIRNSSRLRKSSFSMVGISGGMTACKS